MNRYQRFASEREARSSSNHLSVDWLDMLARLEVWDALAPESRAPLTSLQTSAMLPARGFGPDLDRLVRGNLLTLSRNGEITRMHPSARQFFRVIRALERHDLLDSHQMPDLHAYMIDHFTAVQRQDIAANVIPNETEWRLAGRVANTSWLRDFVEDRSPWSDMEDFVPARKLVRWFLDHPDYVPIRELPERAGLEPAGFDSALRFCFERLLLFPTFRRPERIVLAGPWPTVAKRLARPAPAMPVPFHPAKSFEGAFLIDDMIALLIAASSEPLRVRKNDAAFFERNMTALVAQLTPLPAWLEAMHAVDGERRVKDARNMLEAMNLLIGAEGVLRPGPGAAAWLSLHGADRLRHLLELLRANIPAPAGGATRPDTIPDDVLDADDMLEDIDAFDPDDEFDSDYDAFMLLDDDELADSFVLHRRALRFLPSPVLEWAPLEVQQGFFAALVRAFARAGGSEFIPVSEFLNYEARRGNPFQDDGAAIRRGVRYGFAFSHGTEEELERRWAEMLRAFLFERLFPLGCATIGITRDRIGFHVTPAGRYLLGLTDTFEFREPPDAPPGAVVVQPNFEVVFTAPLPAAEATIARFAERVGQRLGVLFRITRNSILTAAAAGVSAEYAIDALKTVSSRSLPANVTREITGWFGEVRRVSLAPALILRCPDAHTAARVLAAGGKAVRPVSDTVLELVDPQAHTRLLKKLRSAGIFIDERTTLPAKRSRRS